MSKSNSNKKARFAQQPEPEDPFAAAVEAKRESLCIVNLGVNTSYGGLILLV